MNIMSVQWTSRMVAPFMAISVVVVATLVFADHYIHREPSRDSAAVTAAPADSKPATGGRDQDPAGLAAAQAEASRLAAVLGTPPPPDRSNGAPEFDVATIEPTGEAVIAGRAAPGATVELLRNGEPHDRAVADQAGQFVMIPPRLPPGTYGLTLRIRQPDGKETTSKQSVAVAVEATISRQPAVALVKPDQPSVLPSRPPASASDASRAVVEAVRIEPGGKLVVDGRVSPGAAARLYLNDSFVATATADDDGRLAVTINQGIASGNYRVRLDVVESNTGKVSARAEVPFNVPDKVMTSSVAAQTTTSGSTNIAAARPPQLAAAMATVLPSERSPSAVVVPKIATMTVARGDSLWRMSQRVLGAGPRYTVIYRANRDHIRNANLIYPGQIFVLPAR
jgi:nucleoid-associated protein YgaU